MTDSGDISDTEWTVSGHPESVSGDLDTEWTVSGYLMTDSGDISDTEWTVSGHPETGSHGVQHQPIQMQTVTERTVSAIYRLIVMAKQPHSVGPLTDQLCG